MRRAFVVGTTVVGFVACFPITFGVETSTTATMSVKLGDLSGTCSGVVTVEDDNSKATVTKTASGALCNITVDFEATAIDMGEVRAKVEAKIREKDHDPKDVAVTIKAPTDLAFHDIQVVGVTIPSTAWAINMALEGTSVFDAKGDSLVTLVESGQSVTLSDAQLTVVQNAYKDSAEVTVKGKVVLSSVPLDYIQGLQPGTNANVDFKVTADVTASGKTDAI